MYMYIHVHLFDMYVIGQIEIQVKMILTYW